jgi:hypothetical protein
MTIDPYIEKDTEGKFLIVLPLEKIGPYDTRIEAQRLANHIHYFSTNYPGSFEDPETYIHSRNMALQMYEVIDIRPTTCMYEANEEVIHWLTAPQTYYVWAKHIPYPTGVYFLGGGPKEHIHSVVFYSEDPYGEDQRRIVIPRKSTILVDDNIPDEAIEEAKQAELKVCRLVSGIVEYI